MTSGKDKGGLVYSTEHGAMCPRCGKPKAGCVCGKVRASPRGDGIVRIMRETKGRKGKGVCVITGLSLTPGELATLAKQLKQRCGAGGSIKDGVIEIQGDHRETLLGELKKLGYTAKLAGG